MAKERDEQPQAQMIAMPAELMAAMIGMVEKLVERLERAPEGDPEAREALTTILQTHGSVLKQAISPENRLHPDVSYYNPDGERDNPRPNLRRPAYLLGVPLEQPSLHKAEILALNRFDQSLEVPGLRWQARILRDNGGREALLLSVPFQSFDDLRGVGGLLNIINTIHTNGRRPDTNDVIAERLERAEELIAKLQASQVAPDAQPVA